MAAPEPSPPPRAIRLSFAYRDDEITLTERDEVEVEVPRSASLTQQVLVEGDFFAELRAADGASVYRWELYDPLRRSVEVFDPDPEIGIRRATQRGERAGTFSFLVPDVPEADTVVFLTAGRDGASATGTSTGHVGGLVEVARFPLRDPGTV